MVSDRPSLRCKFPFLADRSKVQLIAFQTIKEAKNAGQLAQGIQS
jgi:hypothetical protein